MTKSILLVTVFVCSHICVISSKDSDAEEENFRWQAQFLPGQDFEIRNESTCPVWTHSEHGVTGNKICKCGNSLWNSVTCIGNDNDVDVYLATCYCMSYVPELNTTVVGSCLYGCKEEFYHLVPKDNANLSLSTNLMCSPLNRTGLMCGQCEPGYAPPVYSYALECVQCSSNGYNWLKYIAIAFFPLTVFYLFVILFRTSVTSPQLNAYVLFSQLVTFPAVIQMVYHFSSSHTSPQYKAVSYMYMILVTSFYGIWNLDFFRLVYEPFCLHPKLSTIQVISLDYLVAIYPIFLILVTYILILFHDRFRIFVLLWKPFHWCLFRFRKQWDIRSSLVKAFSTFLLLSYVKLLNVSCSLLLRIKLYDSTEEMRGWALYLDGSTLYFGNDHLPFALLAIIVFCVFNVLPIILLLLFPYRWFQDCLSCCKVKSRLHPFMDAFQGCYRVKPNDCRQFAVVYLLLRIGMIFVFSLTLSVYFFAWAALLVLVVAMLVAMVQPYRQKVYNYVDSILLILMTFLFSGIVFNSWSEAFQKYFKDAFFIVTFPPLFLPPVYFCALVLYNLRRLIPVKIRTKFIKLLKKYAKRNRRTVAESLEESLPYRLVDHETTFSDSINDITVSNNTY